VFRERHNTRLSPSDQEDAGKTLADWTRLGSTSQQDLHMTRTDGVVPLSLQLDDDSRRQGPVTGCCSRFIIIQPKRIKFVGLVCA